MNDKTQKTGDKQRDLVSGASISSMVEIKEMITNNVLCTRQSSRPMTDLLSAKQAFSFDSNSVSVPTGEITMKGIYDDKKKTLEITVSDLKNVPALPLPPSLSLRIYILLTLLPNMSHKKASEILVDFPDCDINQGFIFENVSYHSIFEKSLSVKIMNYEESPTRMIFAETEIFLLEFDFVQNEEITRSLTPSFAWKNGSLIYRVTSADFGAIHIAFKYDLSSEELYIRVIECNNIRIEGYSDDTPGIFVRIISISKQKKSTQKTRLIKKCSSPYFNEELIFNLPLSEHLAASFEFQICVSISSFNADIIAYATIQPQSSTIMRKPYLDAFRYLGNWIVTKISMETSIYRLLV